MLWVCTDIFLPLFLEVKSHISYKHPSISKWQNTLWLVSKTNNGIVETLFSTACYLYTLTQNIQYITSRKAGLEYLWCINHINNNFRVTGRKCPKSGETHLARSSCPEGMETRLQEPIRTYRFLCYTFLCFFRVFNSKLMLFVKWGGGCKD